ncbi:MAG: protein-disulfide reductase DsbD family protein [Candidatus Binataceae bacterium]
MLKVCRRLGLIAAALMGVTGFAQAQTTAETNQVKAELLLEQAAVAPGDTVTAALDLKIVPHWHTYWRTPGDSGLPTTIKWTLPEGVSAGDIEWPLPQRIDVAGLMNFGYEDHVTLLTPLKVAAGAAQGAAEIKADVSWLVCADVCIPQDASFSIPLKIAADAPKQGTPAAQVIAAARETLPKAAPWPVKVTRAGDALTFTAGPGVTDKIKDATFYPYDDGLIVAASPQTLKQANGQFFLAVQAAPKSEKFVDANGVIVLTSQSGATQGFTVGAPVAWTGPAGGASTASVSLAVALVFAFLGGIILNVMPCVLPVLVMKALSFIKQGDAHASERRRDAFAYTAGVMVAFTTLVGGLLVLRAAGSAIGWGFQLQSPAFVAVLSYVMLALGLNLSGVYILGRTFGVGQSLAQKSGATGAFFTGLLAVVVATPCTVPFMGTAVGFAFTQSPAVSILVFEAVALGLAFPYLLFAFIPAAARMLPRPGMWMEHLRQVLAFPLYGAAAWLLWVLAQQVDAVGLAMGFAGVIAVGFAAWVMGVAQAASPRGAKVSTAFAGLAAIAAIAIIASLATRPAALAREPQQVAGDAAVAEPFNVARLKELQASGRPVFVDFTAAWCLTCIVNERVALSKPEVAEAFKSKNVAYMKADWTNQNADITAALHALGRDGVPLYVIYTGAAEPKILPQLLTPTLVADAIKGL